MPSLILELENQCCNSVIFLLYLATFSIHPIHIHGSMSFDSLSWHSLQKFACESAKIISSTRYVNVLARSRIRAPRASNLGCDALVIN
jgi:hypothetical protein